MKRFQFRLQSLLNYKKHLEEMARLEMAKALTRVNACEQQIRTLTRERQEVALKLEKKVADGMDSGDFKRYHGFLAVLDQMVQEQQARKLELEKELEQKRSVLTRRTIDKRAMERLREKRADEYIREMLKEEQKQSDEVVSLKRVRELADESR